MICCKKKIKSVRDEINYYNQKNSLVIIKDMGQTKIAKNGK